MERPKDIDQNSPAANKAHGLGNAARVIIIFHLVGAIGLAIPALRELFLLLVPAHLLLMMMVLLLNYDTGDKKLFYFLILIFIIGFAVEWTGVHTALIFGNYSYGNVLGLKLDEVPLIIGVNWFLLIYATGVTLQHSRIKNQFLRVIIGALILLLLDILIEPVAIKFNYWHWDLNIIPDKNYISWFLISIVLLFVFEQFRFKKQSITAAVLLVSQFIFFAALQ